MQLVSVSPKILKVRRQATDVLFVKTADITGAAALLLSLKIHLLLALRYRS